MPELERSGFVQADDEGEGLARVGSDPHAVDGKEGVGDGEGHPLVAVDERMILGEALP